MTASPLPFLLDGIADSPNYLVNTTGGMTVYAAIRGSLLYVATWSPGDAGPNDHFIFVTDTLLPSAAAPAPWLKAGLVAVGPTKPVLGAAGANNFIGWFNAPSSAACAKSAWNAQQMEGTIDLIQAFGSVPTTLYICAAAYADGNGGKLIVQGPPGNGDGNIDAAEFLQVSTAAITAQGPTGPQGFGVPGPPGPAGATGAPGAIAGGVLTLGEVWVSATRSDNLPGSGAPWDPLNATLTGYDAVMQSIPPSSAIHHSAGTFVRTDNSNAAWFKEGWRMKGVGKLFTTIQMAPNTLTATSAGDVAVLNHRDYTGFLNYCEVSDLTLDTNRANQPAFTSNLSGKQLQGMLIAAKSAKITNVRLLDPWSTTGEIFPFSIFHDASDASTNGDRIEIEGCQVTGCIGSMTAISVISQGGVGFASGFIRNCSVTSDDGVATGYGSGAWKNFDVSENFYDGNGFGYPIVIDTWSYYNVTISKNTFVNCRDIVFNGAGPYSNIIIFGNTVQTTSSIATNVIAANGNANTTLKIFGNTFINGYRGAAAIALGPNVTGDVDHNTISEGVSSAPFPAGVRARDNIDLTGALLYGA